MPKALLKKKVLEEAILHHQSVLENYKNRIRDILSNEGAANDEEQDEAMLAFHAGSSKEVNLLSGQLEVANTEMEELYKMQTYINVLHHQVEKGAVVVTSRGNFFVSGSVKSVEIQGEVYTCLSPASPFFKAMEGLKAGDTFSFRMTTYTIKDVF